MDKERVSVRMNPYLAGALAGLLAVVSVMLVGKFFGASTTFVRTAGMIEKVFNPKMVSQMAYYVKEEPKIEWQWMFIAGVLLGSFLAAILTKTFVIKFVPDFWAKSFGNSALKRAGVAFLGGVIAIIGARLADGCPSGHGLSGLMQLSVSGFVALIFFFLGGIICSKIIYVKREVKK